MGKFQLNCGREVLGHLEISGRSSILKVFSDEEMSLSREPYQYIAGQLYDGRHVSLIHGFFRRAESHFSETGRNKFSVEVFPSYIGVGSACIPKSGLCIESLSFSMEGAFSIFGDSDHFDTVLDPEPFIPLLAKDVSEFRKLDFGRRPIISWFSGKLEIARIDTVLGELCADNRPSFSPGDSHGVRIDNSIEVTLTPPTPVSFEDAMQRLSVLVRLFELIIGREQPLSELSVFLCGKSERAAKVDVHRSFAPRIDAGSVRDESRSPNSLGVLVSASRDLDELMRVIAGYLELDVERSDSRARQHAYLADRRTYSIDRLVSAANAFDILPDSIYPRCVVVDVDLENAVANAKKIFRALPDSLERSAVLGVLGRVGKLSLKHKIGHRVESSGLSQHFPGLFDVLKEAVDCRNHYVHGSKARIDFSRHFDVVCFFTDALEFSLLAPDLIDAGWNLEAWLSARVGVDHPFGWFVTQYRDNYASYQRLTSSADG